MHPPSYTCPSSNDIGTFELDKRTLSDIHGRWIYTLLDSIAIEHRCALDQGVFDVDARCAHDYVDDEDARTTATTAIGSLARRGDEFLSSPTPRPFIGVYFVRFVRPRNRAVSARNPAKDIPWRARARAPRFTFYSEPN